jgi:hypothetical protein
MKNSNFLKVLLFCIILSTIFLPVRAKVVFDNTPPDRVFYELNIPKNFVTVCDGSGLCGPGYYLNNFNSSSTLASVTFYLQTDQYSKDTYPNCTLSAFAWNGGKDITAKEIIPLSTLPIDNFAPFTFHFSATDTLSSLNFGAGQKLGKTGVDESYSTCGSGGGHWATLWFGGTTINPGNILEMSPSAPNGLGTLNTAAIKIEDNDGPPTGPAKTPVLFVPGVLGTELENNQGKLWLDLEKNFSDFGDDFMDPLSFTKLLGPTDPSVKHLDVIAKKAFSVFAFDYSEGLTNEFLNQGYITGTSSNSTFFTFPYDWRYGAEGVIETERGDRGTEGY